MNFHAKSGICSLKNERVMVNLVFGATNSTNDVQKKLETSFFSMNQFNVFFGTGCMGENNRFKKKYLILIHNSNKCFIREIYMSQNKTGLTQLFTKS